MKRLSVLVSSLFIFLGLFVSCKNDIKTEKKAYLTFGDVSRVIQPTQLSFAEDEEISFELKGKYEESEFSTLRTWSYNEENDTAYNQMIQSNIPVELGKWDFELLAIKNEQPFLKGSIVDKNIVIGENILNFGTMEILKEDGLTGSINFKLEFPFDEIKAIKCGLYDLNSNVAIENFESESLNISSPEEGSRFVCYEKTDVPVGIYFMKFELYSDEKAENRIKVYSPVINVVAGHLTEGEDVLESINTFYTIEYELNGASWRDGYEPETYFNKNALVYLPSSDDLIYEGYNFLGWYIDDEKIESPYSYSETTSSGIILKAHWEENLSVIYSYELGRQNYASEGGASLAEVRQNSEGVVTEYKANVVDPTNSQTVWDYYVQPANVYFEEGCNYAVSVKLKSKEDTVVGIQAANADMFFTVNGEQEEWTTCTFETGFIEKAPSDEKNGITIGFALAEEIYISSLKISPIEGDDNLPTLAFNVTKTGINNYLANENKAKNIIEVEKTESNDGYAITINTPLASNNYDSTNTYLYNDVTLELRDYAKNKGINKVAFDFQTLDTVYTSIVADTISPKSMAWNNKRQKNEESISTIFPVFEEGEEVTASIIKISDADVTSQNITSFSIRNFKIEKIDEYSNKYFAIKTPGADGGDEFTEKQSLPVDKTITIPGNTTPKEFDVLMYNRNDSGIDWDEVTRFIYSTEEETINSLRYYIGDDGKYYIQNTGSSEISCKITLTEDFTVQIEDVTTTGGTTSGGEDVGGITYASLPNPEGNGSIDTFYISDLSGLKTYRDLINGTKGFSLSIQPENGTSYTNKFEPVSGHRYDAILTSNITIEDAWTPIGTSSNSFTSSFDGQGHSITFAENSSFSGEYAGVFGYVGNQSASTTSISNLVVKGPDAGITTSAQYAGGIVAYSYGATISNCVNKLKIDASASSTGYLGGIVGYTKKETIISSCANFAELVSTSSIGGIVGFADVENNYSPLSIDKCINIGSIKGSKTNNFVSGILGRTATATTISNCINFGERGCNGGTVPLNHSGVATVTDSGNLTISNCINAGPYVNSNSASIAIADGNIKESSNLYYNKDNWYYDNFGSQVQGNVEDTCTVSGLSTEDFFDSLKCVIVADENWSCVTDKSRYPLPNILGTDENSGVSQSIWQEICYAAKVEVSSGGGEDEITNVATSFEELNNLISSVSSGYAVDNPYVIGIENDITIESRITIANHIKLVSLGEECKLVRSESLQEDNLFLVSADASLTLGDSDSTGSLVIDGDAESTSTTLKKSLINVSTSGTLVLNENSILQNNNCMAAYDATHGGAIYSSGGNININGGTIRNNSTSYKKHLGGAIYLENGTFTMTAGSFENNSTYENGGALYLDSCKTNITGGNFTGNSTTTETTSCYGGAIYILTSSSDSEAAVISNCTFESNTAYQSGGAIYTAGPGNVEIKNCNFKNNTVSNSTAKGGAIYVENTDGSVSVNDCMFDGNTSPAIAKTQSSIVVTVDGEEINSKEWDPSSS